MSKSGKKLRSKISGAAVKTAYLPDGVKLTGTLENRRWTVRIEAASHVVTGEGSGIVDAIRKAFERWHRKNKTPLRELVQAEIEKSQAPPTMADKVRLALGKAGAQ